MLIRKWQLQIHYICLGIDNWMNSVLLEEERLWYSWSATASERVFMTESLYWMEVMAVRQAAVSTSVRGVVFREMKGKSVHKNALWGVCVRVFVKYITKFSLSSFYLKTYSVFLSCFLASLFNFFIQLKRDDHILIGSNWTMIIDGASIIKWMHLLLFFLN